MKTLLLCFAFLLILTPLQTPFTPTLQTIQLAPNIYQFITPPDGYVPNGNSVVVINDSDVLVFDTFTRPSTARAEIDAIRRLTTKPVTYVVNSHWHPDHWSGNQAFEHEFPAVEFIATNETRELMLNIANTWPKMFEDELREDQSDYDKEIQTNKLDDGSPLTNATREQDKKDLALEKSFVDEARTVHRVYPTLTFADKLTLHRGSREFQFFNMVGDAAGTTVLYLPQEKILITGDALSYPVPYYTPPLPQHLQTLRTLAQFDAAIIVPGHGPAFHDKNFLNLEAQLLDSVITQVRAVIRKGAISIADVQAQVNVENLRPQFTHDDPALDRQFRRYAKGMAANAYRALRDSKSFEQ
jgi:cyclase